MGLFHQPKREGASREFLPSLRLSLPTFIYEPQTREWRAGSSRVGAVFERREREQKRSGGEGGGSANILVRGIKCSVAFASSFRFAITGSCFSTSIVALRPSNRRLQASENFSFVWCGLEGEASSRGFAINLGVGFHPSAQERGRKPGISAQLTPLVTHVHL